MNATQCGPPLSKRAPLREWILRAAFAQLYTRLAFLHELTGRLAFGRAWSARRRLLIVVGDQSERVLDIGCGDGRLLAEPAWRSTLRFGVDPSTQATRRARRRGVEVVRACAQQLPLRDSSIDRVVCCYPGPWILDDAAWAELARVLKSGAAMSVLVGGITTRGRGAWARRLLQRVAYGPRAAEDAGLPPNTFGHVEIPGTLSRMHDDWGVAYLWRGQRVTRD